MNNIFGDPPPDAIGDFGDFGDFGGSFVPAELQIIIDEITELYLAIPQDTVFLAELTRLYQHIVGRPSPIFHAQILSERYGAPIYLKREDLNHTGAHKINHCLGEALLAKKMGKKMGKKKVIAETGAGALVVRESDIYMGEVDIAKEHPNVVWMRILGANMIPVTHVARLSRRWSMVPLKPIWPIL